MRENTDDCSATFRALTWSPGCLEPTQLPHRRVSLLFCCDAMSSIDLCLRLLELHLLGWWRSWTTGSQLQGFLPSLRHKYHRNLHSGVLGVGRQQSPPGLKSWHCNGWAVGDSFRSCILWFGVRPKYWTVFVQHLLSCVRSWFDNRALLARDLLIRVLFH